MKRIPCSGCSLLCDDIIIRSDGIFIDEVVGACIKGKERFDQVTAKNRITTPMIRKDGELVKVSWEEALNKTKEIMKKSSSPLLYGFSTVSCEAQLKAMELASIIDGFIDSNASICQGKVLSKSIDTGISLTSITEIINKADLLILWGSNAAESIPRLLNKVLFSRGKFRMTGREIKTLIIIDPVKTASFNVMGVRDLSLFIEPDKDLELIRALKDECCAVDIIPPEGVAGLDSDDMRRLLLQLSGAEYGVIFLGQGLLKPNPNADIIKELLELVDMINTKQEKGRISLVLLGGHYNMTGFEQVSLSKFGKIGGIQFQGKEMIDSEENLISKIKNENFDCSFIMGTDPIAHLPFKLSKALARKPIIVVDNHKSATGNIADVLLPTAITGIECEGLAYRLDFVPIQLQKVLNPPSKVPSDYELLNQIITLIKDTESG